MRLSIVLLTLDEETNIGRCLDALATQTSQDFEVIVIDADSQDRTVQLARGRIQDFPVPLRVRAETRLPIGAARNLGARMANSDAVAYLSADTEAAPDWVERALAGLEKADMVFGRQVHAPDEWTPAASIRGLRYMFPAEETDDALRYASNVAGVFRRGLLLRYPFDDAADAAEDLLLARRAAAAGSVAVYDPAMVVEHHDVVSLREEMRKNVREGRAWGRHADELGGIPELVAWGIALTASLLSARRHPLVGGLAFAATLYAPALRRASRHREMPTAPLLTGVALSPFFDLAFYLQYLRGQTQKVTQ